MLFAFDDIKFYGNGKTVLNFHFSPNFCAQEKTKFDVKNDINDLRRKFRSLIECESGEKLLMIASINHGRRVKHAAEKDSNP
jgi:hypothetical protein